MEYLEATKDIYVYTDYPKVTWIHDEEQVEHGFFKVKLLGYDLDKYVTVVYPCGHEQHIKSGYIYKKCTIPKKTYRFYRNHYPEGYRWISPCKLLLNKKDYSKFIKEERKNNRRFEVVAKLYKGDSYCDSVKFRFAKEARKFWNKTLKEGKYSVLLECTKTKHKYGHMFYSSLEYDLEEGIIWERSRKCVKSLPKRLKLD